MKKIYNILILMLLTVSTGCSPKNKSDEGVLDLGNVCESATITAFGYGEQFHVDNNTNPLDLIDFLQDYLFYKIYSDKTRYIKASFSFENSALKSFSSEMEILEPCQNDETPYMFYMCVNTKIDNKNLSYEIYQKQNIDRSQGIYDGAYSLYKEGKKAVAGQYWEPTKSPEYIGDLPGMPSNDDPYGAYYYRVNTFYNSYFLYLTPGFLDKSYIEYWDSKYSFSRSYDITIYENYTVLKMTDNLGLLNSCSNYISRYEAEIVQLAKENNCNEEITIYIDNDTCFIDKAEYKGKVVDFTANMFIMNIDFSIVRKQFSQEKMDEKKENLIKSINSFR